ncbi:DNA cytosine methyltransferase [Marinomonas hwangdonensis]|uniref:DNA (cytosine-5-)-methyltransferase n=1 Tax=Marinomonas hwangdonensis TaxID=1053647 RepID=A0A3M8QA79_9GAMM|nr:DNA cytosine methyltransferase [Marinomonas hwangdonensis]RNF52957.1 DNA cytosine methyltransferase [Marinomonas hwangdonensis]
MHFFNAQHGQLDLHLPQELIVDNFAGGGGASTGLEMALGRPVDIAINHDEIAIKTHAENHPDTIHYCESVWDINPAKVCKGRPVAVAWFSPDCKHFSKAKGGKPVDKNIRGLAWVAVRWAATVRPKIIMLENVEEFKTWGPVKDGEPLLNQKGESQKGKTFKNFVRELIKLGYKVEWNELRASDYGVPTTRKRFFLIARCDGQPIAWITPTHGDPKSLKVQAGKLNGKLKPWMTAADIIDWSLPCPSIFDRKRPLAENTLKRIAKGLQRFVIESDKPFVVPSFITEHANASNQRNMPIDEPVRTICAQVKGGHFALVHAKLSPFIVGAGGPEYAGKPKSANVPLNTITTQNHSQVVTAFLAKHYGGNYTGSGINMHSPTDTVTTVDHHALVTSHLIKMRNNNYGSPVSDPVPTITAGGNHIGEVRAFLVKYYGTGEGCSLDEPLHTVTTKDRFGLVTIHGEDYQIVDIGMRMLSPRELYRAQGFPDSYIIDQLSDGTKLSKAAQVRMCGNSVCPLLAAALVKANTHTAQTTKQTKAA